MGSGLGRNWRIRLAWQSKHNVCKIYSIGEFLCANTKNVLLCQSVFWVLSHVTKSATSDVRKCRQARRRTVSLSTERQMWEPRRCRVALHYTCCWFRAVVTSALSWTTSRLFLKAIDNKGRSNETGFFEWHWKKKRHQKWKMRDYFVPTLTSQLQGCLETQVPWFLTFYTDELLSGYFLLVYFWSCDTSKNLIFKCVSTTYSTSSEHSHFTLQCKDNFIWWCQCTHRRTTKKGQNITS